MSQKTPDTGPTPSQRSSEDRARSDKGAEESQRPGDRFLWRFGNQDRERGKRPGQRGGSGRGDGNSRDGGGKDGGQPTPIFSRAWLWLLPLVVLIGLLQIREMSQQRVSFDQFVQLVEQGKLKRVSFQPDTILGEAQSDEKDSKSAPAATPAKPAAPTGNPPAAVNPPAPTAPAPTTAPASPPAPAMGSSAGGILPANATSVSVTGQSSVRIYRTGRLESAERDLILKLNEKKVPYDSVSTQSWLATVGGWILPMVLLYVFASWLFRRAGGGLGGMGGFGGSVTSFGKNKAQVWADGDKATGVTFADVAGQKEAKAELVEIIDFLRFPERYTRLGGRIPRGVLLVGPPGTGKTLLARAVAGEAKVPFLSISGSEFVEMFVGVGAARVRDLFNQAKDSAPSIIFIDELDAIGRARGVAGPVATHEEREQTLDQLLSEMDGFDTSAGVIIMAATNRPEILDPALLRAGRFDRRVVVDRPTLEDRLEILQVHSRKVVLDKDVRLDQVAAVTAGLVGADLANLVNEAALLAARRHADAVNDHDFQEAVERVIAGLERRSRRLSPKDKQQVAYHECGHALIATLIPGMDAVKKVSIVPRGIGALGYTMQQPSATEGDRYLLTRAEIFDRIAVLLGGRAAEEELLADISTGAQDDLQRATSLARRMVTEFGMSKSLGLQSFDNGRGQFLDVGGFGPREVSDETARNIDQEVRELLDGQYERTRSLIREHKPGLLIAVEELLTHEILDGQRFRDLVLGSKAAAL